MRSFAVLAVLTVAACGRLGFDARPTDIDSDGGTDVTVAFASGATLVDEASGAVAIAIVLSAPSDGLVRVGCDIVGGTATSADFVLDTATITIDPGATSGAVSLSIASDIVEEPDETIELRLSNAIGATLGHADHVVTISAGILPRVRIRTASAGDVVEGDGATTLLVALDRPSPEVIEVEVVATTGSAIEGADYTYTTAMVSFAAGELEKAFTIASLEDELDEDNEHVVLEPRSTMNVIVPPDGSYAWFITDDDLEPVVEFQTTELAVPEDPITTQLVVELGKPSGRTVTVPFAVTLDSSATGTDDYTLQPSPLTIPAGTTQVAISIAIRDDTIAESVESVLLALQTPTNGVLGGTRNARVNIIDDDSLCFGPPSEYRVCVAAVPDVTTIMPTTFDTTASPSCAADQPLGWVAQGQPPVCMVVARSIIISSTTRVTGTRPLLLVAMQDIDITGTLDVASHIGGAPGPGANIGDCNDPMPLPLNDTNGGDGGPGGSFMVTGGRGGGGNGRAAVNPAVPTPIPTRLRGGCSGAPGGNGASGTAAPGGSGGGAVYIVAGGRIGISGLLDASGAGARVGGPSSGGSGGGSGGMVKLYASEIVFGGRLLVNGGGGSSGSSATQIGMPGSDPNQASPFSPAPGGAGPAPGGNGFATPNEPTHGQPGGSGVGGGGGGGDGGYIESNMPIVGGSVSGARIVVTPN